MKATFIKRILIPVDFSITALKAVDHAITIAKITNAEIYLLHVIEHVQVTTDPLYFAMPKERALDADLARMSNVSLSKVEERIKAKGISRVKTITVFGRTHKMILKISKKIKSDLIVMGTHGVSGFREFIMGSNAYRVVSDAQCPVLTVQKKNKAGGYKNILVPFTDTPHSRSKVGFTIQMGKLFGAKITVLGFDRGLTKAASKKIVLQGNQIREIIEKHGLTCTVKITDEPYTAKIILDYVKKAGIDMLTVIGNTDKRDITEYFKGSLAQQLINHSELPVLSVHAVYNPDNINLRFY